MHEIVHDISELHDSEISIQDVARAHAIIQRAQRITVQTIQEDIRAETWCCACRKECAHSGDDCALCGEHDAAKRKYDDILDILARQLK